MPIRARCDAEAPKESNVPLTRRRQPVLCRSAPGWRISRRHDRRQDSAARGRALGLDGLQGPLNEAGLDVIGPGQKADGVEAVISGWYREFRLARSSG